MKPNCEPLATTIAKPLEPSRPDPTLEPSELLQIPLEQDAVQRFIKLKRKKQLESNPNTVYCPRSWCQGPARTKPSAAAAISTLQTPATESDENKRASSSAPPLPAPSDRLAICEDCSFAFCLVCKISWHGEYYVCFPRSQFELTAEERASEDFLKLHTQACPTCNARAQKTMGCNHMICFKCDTHFCYLCGSYLQRENPYQHFNDRKNGCFMRLWELEEGDEGGAAGGHAFAGGVPIADPPAIPDAPLAPIDRWIPEEASDDDTDEDAAYFAERWAEPIGINLADLNININIPPPAPMPPPHHQRNVNHPNQIQGNARAGRGRGNAPQDRNQPAQPPARPADHEADDDERREGLRRFLRMVQDDREDKWDSDEMSDPGAELNELAQ